MGGHFLYVMLQQIDIGKDGVVDALQYIVGGIRLNGVHLIGVVDESVAQGLYFAHSSLEVEQAEDGVEIFHC